MKTRKCKECGKKQAGKAREYCAVCKDNHSLRFPDSENPKDGRYE